MQPAEISYRAIKVEDAAGNAVLGLVTGSFTPNAFGRGYGAAIMTAYAHGTVVQEVGAGWYDVAFAAPASAGWMFYRIKPTSALYRITTPNEWSGEVEAQDLGSMYGAVVRPVATLAQGAQLGMPLPLELVAYRYRALTIPVVDQTGAAYTALATDFPSATLRMSVRSKDQTTTTWNGGPSATPTGFLITTSGSTLSITIPEDATFFSALTQGIDSIDTLYWEVTGDLGSDTAKTVPVIRSSNLRLTRREVGT